MGNETNMNPTTTVRAAIEATPAGYFSMTCATRAGKGGSRTGSFFRGLDPGKVAAMVRQLEWEPYSHPDVQEPAKAFVARNVFGTVGVLPISEVPDSANLVWDDSKDTGKVECVWQGAPDADRRVDFVVMLIGPGDDDDGKPLGQVVWTFFPGEPVQPSQVKRLHRWGEGKDSCGVDDYHGMPVKREAAVKEGVKYVKLA